MSLAGKIAIAICFALVAPSVSMGNILLRDTLESGSISSTYTQSVNNPTASGTLAVTSAAAFLGTKSLEMTYAAGVTTGVAEILDFSTPVSDIYMRYAIRFKSGFEWDLTGNKISRTWSLPATPSNDIYFWVKNPVGAGNDQLFTMYVNQLFANGQTSNLNAAAPAPTVDTERWYCFDIYQHWDADGLGTGILKIWVDGALKWDYPATIISSIPFTKAEIGGNYSSGPPTVNSTVYYDHVIMADSEFVDLPSDHLCHPWPNALAWRVTQTTRPAKGF